MDRVAYGCMCAALTMLMACGSEVSGTTSGSGSGSGGNGQGGDGSGASGASVGGNGSGGSDGGSGAGSVVEDCIRDHHYPLQPQYDQFNPTVGSHCAGTNHQDITGVERVVFLGDSITQGTFPTPSSQVYRALLGDKLSQKWPGVQIDECAVNGARVDDFLSGDNQIADCFPGPEPLTTLVVITMGGNDIITWPQNDLTQSEAETDADAIAATFREAIDWFYEDPARFPNGVYVVFASVYEYTDGTGELGSCPGANFLGLGGDYLVGAPALSKLTEKYMEIAVDTGTDMIFLLEEFCGHGYRRDEESSSCYVGPDAELWFDVSCIHPTPAGHNRLAELFEAVINE